MMWLWSEPLALASPWVSSWVVPLDKSLNLSKHWVPTPETSWKDFVSVNQPYHCLREPCT